MKHNFIIYPQLRMLNTVRPITKSIKYTIKNKLIFKRQPNKDMRRKPKLTFPIQRSGQVFKELGETGMRKH